MSEFTSRPFDRAQLPDLHDFVTNNAIARWPAATYMMNSDIAWQLPGSNPKASLRLWYDDAEALAGFAWLSLNAAVTLDLRSDLSWDHPIAEDMLVWLETERRRFPAIYPWLLELKSMDEWQQALTDDLPAKAAESITFQIGSFDTDTDRTEFLESHGYVATEHFEHYMLRSLDTPIPDATLSNDIVLRHVVEADFPERIAVHRDAWFKSTYNMEAYLRVRHMSAFDPELDIVAEDKAGLFGAYCIGWIDERLKVGSFEPVGTRPSFRRLGLGQQVNFEGLRRMKAKGMSDAKIGTAGFNDPAFNLYLSCGFDATDKNRTYVKRDD